MTFFRKAKGKYTEKDRELVCGKQEGKKAQTPPLHKPCKASAGPTARKALLDLQHSVKSHHLEGGQLQGREGL